MLHVHVCPEGAERLDVRVERASANSVAARHRQLGTSLACQEWASEDEARTHLLANRRVRGRAAQV